MAKELYIGRYKVIKELGRGGMGIVYKGEDPILDRLVAIKVLPPKKTASKKAVQRFLREARVSARLDHPHIVKIYDIGEEDGLFHIVMEYVPGDSLRDIVEADGAVDMRYMAGLFAQLCNAMAYAHEQKITHRDIKPENIKVTDDNKVKVMDFGIAVLDDSHSITETGSVMGTIAYFSPEQAKGGEADYRADIYSMGVVFYEMLTKYLPFDAHSLPEMLNKHLYEAPILPTNRNPAVPKEFEDLILRCMEKRPEDRFQSASEMERIVRDWLDGASRPRIQPAVNEDRLAALKAELLSSISRDRNDEKEREEERRVQYELKVQPSAELRRLLAEADEKVEMAERREAEKTLDGDKAERPAEKPAEKPAGPDSPRPLIPPLYQQPVIPVVSAGPKAETSDEAGAAGEKQDPIEDLKSGLSMADIPAPSAAVPPMPLPPAPAQEIEADPEAQERYNKFIDKMKAAAESSRTMAEGGVYSSSIICPSCGQENLSSQNYCTRCNEPLPSLNGEICDASYQNSRGLSYFASGDYAEALEHFNMAIRYNPDYSPAYYNIGRVYLEENDGERAFKAFTDAVDMFPDEPEGYMCLAEYYRRADRPGDAVGHYLKALKLDQNNIEARSALASLYAQQGDVSAAVREYSYILEADPDNADSHKQLGYLYSGINRIDSAIREFEAYLKYDPENAQVYAWLGDLYKKKRRYGQAERNYNSAITINPDDAAVYTSLSDLYIKQNKTEMARRTIGSALAIEEDNREARLQLADMYLSRGDGVSAAAELERIAASHPGDTEVHQHLGELYMTMGSYDRAIDHYEKSVESEGASPNASSHNKLGMLYMKKDYTQLGILEYKQAVSLQPCNPEYREDLGMAYYCQGDKPRAIEELKKAATLDCKNVDYYKAIGVIMEEEGRYDEAINMFRTAEELSPRDSVIPAMIGKVYFNQGFANMALTEYQKALDLQPTNYLYYIYIAKAYARTNRPDMAIEAFKKAINLMPTKNIGEFSSVMTKAYIDSARDHIDRGEYAKARQVLLSAEKLDPDNPSVAHLLGVTFIHEKKGKDAYDYVMKALKAQPSNVAFLMDYARVAVLLGDCDTALRTWSKARDLAPSKIELYPLKIDIYIAAGRYNDAVSFVNGLMSGDPANEPYYHSLKAYAASARKDFLAEEKERFAAMKTSGYSWEYARDYAVFLKSRNRSNEAAEFFRIAAENCPNDRVREEIMALESGE